MKPDFTQYHQAVRYLESIPIISKADYFTKKTGRSIFLKRFAYFLNLLGNPQHGLRYIHISGSSGKGSVAYMIETILTSAGYNVGLYTSPHCTTTIERIKASGKLIAPNEFVRYVKKLKPKIAYAKKHSPYGAPSYFEIMTAIAFLYFQKKKCDYVVLEVGLGGSFDATNIIDRAVATVINLIDYDHINILGNRLSAIAQEKSAIIKPSTAVFTTARNHASVLGVIKKRCRTVGVPLNIISPPSKKITLPLLGQHQQENATLAQAVCQFLGITKTTSRQSLKNVYLPCRFEIVKQQPLIILDGAHNISKIRTTVATLEQLLHQKSKKLTAPKLYLIIALTKERNPKKIFQPLLAHAEKIFVTQFSAEKNRRYPPRELAQSLHHPNVVITSAPSQALTKALYHATNNDIILLTGSLYLAGEIRNKFIAEKKILKQRKI